MMRGPGKRGWLVEDVCIHVERESKEEMEARAWYIRQEEEEKRKSDEKRSEKERLKKQHQRARAKKAKVC